MNESLRSQYVEGAATAAEVAALAAEVAALTSAVAALAATVAGLSTPLPPGGDDGDIQFNDGGAFGGIAGVSGGVFTVVQSNGDHLQISADRGVVVILNSFTPP